MEKKWWIVIVAVVVVLFLVTGPITGYALYKPSCPNECCLSGGDYDSKSCEDSTYSCVSNQCVKCGNDVKEVGENCKNCPSDASCGANQECSVNGDCIQLGTSQNCARIGDRCGNYEECRGNNCIQKDCQYECCSGSTYAYKGCGSLSKCENNKCVNEVIDVVTDTIDNVVDNIFGGLW